MNNDNLLYRIQGLEAELAASQEQNQQLLRQLDVTAIYHDGVGIQMDAQKAELAASREREARLREALEEYGQHEDACAKWNKGWGVKCDCGLDAALSQSSAPASEPAVPEGYAKVYLPVSVEARLKALPQCISGPCTIEEAPDRTHWEVYTPYCMVLAPNEHAADYIAGNLNMLFAVLNDPMTFTKSA